MTGLTYLITGVTQGIGRAYLEALLKRPGDNTYVGAVRDPRAATTQELLKLDRDFGNKLIIVKIDNENDKDPFSAVEELKKDGVDRIDVVVANAGASMTFGPLHTVQLDRVRKMVDVNAIATLALFQATKPLLDKSDGPGKFIYVGTHAASMAILEHVKDVPFTALFATKCMAHHLVRTIYHQNPDLDVAVFSPGVVVSNLQNNVVQEQGMTGEQLMEMLASMNPITTDEYTPSLVWAVDNLSRKSTGDIMVDTQESFKKKEWVAVPW